jgi:hypothetical protein
MPRDWSLSQKHGRYKTIMRDSSVGACSQSLCDWRTASAGVKESSHLHKLVPKLEYSMSNGFKSVSPNSEER